MSIKERMEDLKDRALKNREVNVRREHPTWSDDQVMKEVLEGTTVRDMIKNKHKKEHADRRLDAKTSEKHFNKVKVRKEYRNIVVEIDGGPLTKEPAGTGDASGPGKWVDKVDADGKQLFPFVDERYQIDKKKKSGGKAPAGAEWVWHTSVDVENDLELQASERRKKEEDIAGVIERVEKLLGEAAGADGPKAPTKIGVFTTWPDDRTEVSGALCVSARRSA